MAIARGIKPEDPNFAVPDLFLNVFPSWFVGVAFAAIAIGALVPAAVMSIAAANLFTRNDLQGVPAPGRVARRRGADGEDRLAARQGRRARDHRDAADEVRDRAAAARRRVDPADAAGDRRRALHALAAPLGARRRLGRRHDGRDAHGRVAGLRRDVPAGLLRHDDQRLHGHLRADRQPRRDARADAACCARGAQGRRRRGRRDAARRLRRARRGHGLSAARRRATTGARPA